MQRGSRFIYISPRLPRWGWVALAPLAVLWLFFGAVFLLLFAAFGVLAVLVYWIRWKWAATSMGAAARHGRIRRESRRGCAYDYELQILKEKDDGRP